MADDTRTRIMMAAGPIFARVGFEGATVREICDAAEVNVASVNYHFGDKRNLYIETVRHARELRAEQVPFPELPPDSSTAQQLHGYVSTMLNRMLGSDIQPWQTQLMMREMLDPTEDCRDMVEGFFRPRLDRLLEILDPVFPPDFDDARRHQFAFSVMGQCLFYRVGHGIVEIVVPAEQRQQQFGIEQLAHHITSLTLAALSVTPLVTELQ